MPTMLMRPLHVRADDAGRVEPSAGHTNAPSQTCPRAVAGEELLHARNRIRSSDDADDMASRAVVRYATLREKWLSGSSEVDRGTTTPRRACPPGRRRTAPRAVKR